MKSVKLALVIISVASFLFACSQTTTSNTNAANTAANRTITQNFNGTTVSYEAVETNSDNAAKPTDELASARKIFTEKCVSCHKENGEGGEMNLEGVKFKVPNYKSDKAIKATDEKLLDYIENGDDEMPSFKGKLSPEEMKSLVKFIRKEFQGK